MILASCYITTINARHTKALAEARFFTFRGALKGCIDMSTLRRKEGGCTSHPPIITLFIRVLDEVTALWREQGRCRPYRKAW